MIISPFTPLFFSPSTDKFGAKSKYVQLFARTDRIFIELIASPDEQEPVVYINNLLNDASTSIILSSWQMNDDEIIYFYNISLLPCGYYNVAVNGKISEIFKITDDEHELFETTLIQYSMKDNKQRLDTVWWIDGMQYFFDLRVPGGFKDNGWTFGVDNEQFMTSEEDIVELFSHEYTTMLFTLGNAMGCPVWFAELFNRVLCCNYIYFDGVRYARKEGNVPELNQQIEGLKSFVFNQMLQKVKTMNPTLEWNNQVSMRRIYSDNYRVIANDRELRSLKLGFENEKYKIPNPPQDIYVNLEDSDYIADGTTLIDYNILELSNINKNSSRGDSYWMLCRIAGNAISDTYLDRNTGASQLIIAGLDNLTTALGLEKYTLELRVDLIVDTHPVNGIAVPLINSADNTAATDGSITLNPISKASVTNNRSFAIYLQNVPPAVTAIVADNPLNIKLTYTK